MMHYSEIYKKIAKMKREKTWDLYRGLPLSEIVNPTHKRKMKFERQIDGDKFSVRARSMYYVKHHEGQTFIWSI